MDPNENNRNCPSSGSDGDGPVLSTALSSAPLSSTQQQQHRPSSSIVAKVNGVRSSAKSLNKGNNSRQQQQQHQRKRKASSLPLSSHAVISVGGDEHSKKRRRGLGVKNAGNAGGNSNSSNTNNTNNSNINYYNSSGCGNNDRRQNSPVSIAPTVNNSNSNSNNNNANTSPSSSPAAQHPLPGNMGSFCKSCDAEDPDLNSKNTKSCESVLPSNEDDGPHDIDWCKRELEKNKCGLNKDIIDFINEVILPQKPKGMNVKWLVSIMIGLCPTPEDRGHESLGMRGRRNGHISKKKTALSILLAQLFGKKCLPTREQGGIDSENEDITTIFWANAREWCTNNGIDCFECRSWRMNEARAIGKALCILSKCVKHYGGNIVAINVAGVSVNAHYIFDILSKDGKFDGLSPMGTHISKLGSKCKCWTKKHQCTVAKSTLVGYDDAFCSSFKEIGFEPELSFLEAGLQSPLCKYVNDDDGEVGSLVPHCSKCLLKAATHVDMHLMEELKVNDSCFNEGQDDEEAMDGDTADDKDNAGFNIESCMYCEECCDSQEDGIMPLEEFRSEEKRRKGRERYAKKKAEYELLKQKEGKGGVLTEEEVMKIKKVEDAEERRRQRDAEKKAEYEFLKQKEEKGAVLTEEEVMKIKKFEDAQERRRQRDAEKKAEYVSLKQKEEKGGVLTEEEVMKIQKFEDAEEKKRQWRVDNFGWGIDNADIEAQQQARRDERNEYRREEYAEMKAEYELLKQKEEKEEVLTNEEVMKIKKVEDAKERRRQQAEKENESNNQRRDKVKAEYVSLKQKEEKGEVLTNEELMKIKKFENAKVREKEYGIQWRANNPDYQSQLRAKKNAMKKSAKDRKILAEALISLKKYNDCGRNLDDNVSLSANVLKPLVRYIIKVENRDGPDPLPQSRTKMLERFEECKLKDDNEKVDLNMYF